jgi:hypothetical protein
VQLYTAVGLNLLDEYTLEFRMEGSDGGSPKRLLRLGLPWTVSKTDLLQG